MKYRQHYTKAIPKGGRYSLQTFSDDSLKAIASGGNPVMVKLAQDILDKRTVGYRKPKPTA